MPQDVRDARRCMSASSNSCSRTSARDAAAQGSVWGTSLSWGRRAGPSWRPRPGTRACCYGCLASHGANQSRRIRGPRRAAESGQASGPALCPGPADTLRLRIRYAGRARNSGRPTATVPVANHRDAHARPEKRAPLRRPPLPRRLALGRRELVSSLTIAVQRHTDNPTVNPGASAASRARLLAVRLLAGGRQEVRRVT